MHQAILKNWAIGIREVSRMDNFEIQMRIRDLSEIVHLRQQIELLKQELLKSQEGVKKPNARKS